MWDENNPRCRTPEWKALKRQARRQLPNGCADCGQREGLELDHITPHFEGGADNLENLQWLCGPCHKRKTDEESLRARARKAATLRRVPRLPFGLA
ncbi:MAG: HNH endonuclease signature motif containing protein [Corynebacterium sp.]|uniref:HNH endonuclease n=1 Tax=Corynebacterium sp. TaxID=1720 RepID=UPI0026DC7F3F|nr:HNH endonuclease signature motif containing protein [Corynebacterium sp.]MDO5099306.1 HNH endonuclease signature motif containing protein [Corynebacterium sp.]